MQINRLCVDIYQGNTVVDFRAVYDAGIRLVIHKASEGATLRDPKYAERRKAARVAGLMWGAYHFARGSDVDAQVSNFLRAADPDPDMRLVLDWEVPAMTPIGARAFLSAVDNEIGRPTVLYSYSSFLREQLGQKIDTFLGARPLWLAAYSKVPPTPQPTWKKWLLWQYTDGESGPEPRTVPGIAGLVDCNHFEGTEAELRAAWLGTDAPAAGEPWETPGWQMFHDPRLAWVQSQINHLMPDVSPIPVDGLRGPLTDNMVRAYQRRHGLTVDGIPGDHETIPSIKAALAAQQGA